MDKAQVWLYIKSYIRSYTDKRAIIEKECSKQPILEKNKMTDLKKDQNISSD